MRILNNTSLNNQWGMKTYGCSKISTKREVYNGKCLIKKDEISPINNLILHLKGLEKEQTKLKVSRRKQIVKIRAEINELENRNTIGKGTSLVVQWLRLRAPNAGGPGSICGQGTKILHTTTKPVHHNY